MDELPQLLNVLKGDMSLVGPRPPIPAEVEKYERWQRRRLSMRPGITCIHEVVARNNRDFNQWMKLDLEYIDNWSFTLDFKILARTVFAVLRGTGC
jgi:lipopolysaccharide/colanic/teichoic acid biosynthesis glycosyltransferase